MNIDAAHGTFDWPLAYEAEDLLRKFILAFLKKNQFAGHLAERMSQDTGTDFFEWIDYITITSDDLPEFQNVGFVPDHVESESDVYYHPKAILPRVLVRKEGFKEGIPMVLAIRPESIVDFAPDTIWEWKSRETLAPDFGRYWSANRMATDFWLSNV